MDPCTRLAVRARPESLYTWHVASSQPGSLALILAAVISRSGHGMQSSELASEILNAKDLSISPENHIYDLQ